MITAFPLLLLLSVTAPTYMDVPSQETATAVAPTDILETIKPGMSEAEVVAQLGAAQLRSPTPWGDIIVTWELPEVGEPAGRRRTVRFVFDADGKMLRRAPNPTNP